MKRKCISFKLQPIESNRNWFHINYYKIHFRGSIVTCVHEETIIVPDCDILEFMTSGGF